jgi:alpha-beta hydrolase superfamily lysophospholipase
MLKRREGQFLGSSKNSMFFQLWENPKAQGTLIICHGQGEHSESYVRVIDALKDDRWTICALDLRGHGRSDGKRGYAENFQVYCDDYYIFLQKVIAELKNSPGPVALLSHSLGGLVQLKTLIDHPDLPIAAQVCSSPLLGVAVPVPDWKNRAATFLNQWTPKVTLWNEITNDMLTRDPDIIREFEQDVLRHNRMSPGVFLGLKDTIEIVQVRASEIKVPTLFQLAEHDRVVSTPDAQKFFENLGSPDKKMLVYGDDARHELYNDTSREVALQDLKTYLDQVLGRNA